jgi:hypothetical protein
MCVRVCKDTYIRIDTYDGKSHNVLIRSHGTQLMPHCMMSNDLVVIVETPCKSINDFIDQGIHAYLASGVHVYFSSGIHAYFNTYQALWHHEPPHAPRSTA